MMNIKLNDFEKYAVSKGIGTNTLNSYNNVISPMILEERHMNVTAIDIYSRLMYDKIIFLGTGIDDTVANIINAQLLYLNSISDKDETIKMFINSGGGSVIDGLSIYDTMNFVAPDVSTYCLGMAASMASVLVSSGVKGQRYALPNSTVMIHQVSSGTGHVQNADLQIVAKESQKWQNKLYNILAKNTGKSFEDIERDADRDNWMTAEEAVNYGLIDEIIEKQN